MDCVIGDHYLTNNYCHAAPPVLPSAAAVSVCWLMMAVPLLLCLMTSAEKTAYLSLAPNMRVPFLNPAAAFTANATFTIMDSATVPVINVTSPTAAMINV